MESTNEQRESPPTPTSSLTDHRRHRKKHYSSFPSKAGNLPATLSHPSFPFTIIPIACTISSKLARTCLVLSRSRSVNPFPSKLS